MLPFRLVLLVLDCPDLVLEGLDVCLVELRLVAGLRPAGRVLRRSVRQVRLPQLDCRLEVVELILLVPQVRLSSVRKLSMAAAGDVTGEMNDEADGGRWR